MKAIELSFFLRQILYWKSDFKPDLIFIGRRSTPLSGEQSIKIIKENCITPIVFISGSATLEDMQNSGADAYISKPIDINKFLLITKSLTSLN